ncbi:YlzJ-like family protein [Hazenella coriacea]|uniref:YlzJ-like protein n=1 Tax=Hazenella coriacea TaxID=1179467 RepID=A0A4R3L5P2_9BACL|nr:YlzJ-like family protein [Hazenella coriacea]TCS92567.1 YlzJ-like protein [Hazenella coriacea]
MIYYSVMPQEVAFQDEQNNSSKEKEMVIDGVHLSVRMDNADEGTIIRVLCADLYKFLEPRFQPGEKLQFIPEN